MDDLLSPRRLAEDAVYLGILTVRDVKPLSRLEYAVAPLILDFLHNLGLLLTPIERVTRNGRTVTHLILGRDRNLIDRYRAEFDTTVLQGETAAMIHAEAQYFGYPECCAAAYSKHPYAPNHLHPEERALLFHTACPGCTVTPALIPQYQSAFIQAKQIYKIIRTADVFT
jgi:hypothetical protein